MFNNRTRLAASSIAIAALLTITACSGDEQADPATTSQTTAASSSSAETTSAPASSEPQSSEPESSEAETSSAPASSQAPAGKHTDESLAAAMKKVPGLTPLPIASVRSGQGASDVNPAECQFAAEGYLPALKEGGQGAVGLAQGGAGAMFLAAKDPAAEIKKRDDMLDNPKCANVTVTQMGQKVETTISSEKASVNGLESARYMTSVNKTAATTVKQLTLSGVKDGVLINVSSPAGDKAAVDKMMQQMMAALG